MTRPPTRPRGWSPTEPAYQPGDAERCAVCGTALVVGRYLPWVHAVRPPQASLPHYASPAK